MLFDIIDGVPYLICGDTAYRVEIKDGQIKYDTTLGEPAFSHGKYSLQEVISKLGNTVKPKTKRNKKENGLLSDNEGEAL